jgi:hypothetical protein
MSLYDIAAAAFGRVLWRVALALIVAAFGIVAIYHFTAAGMLALATRFGDLHAQLIVAAIYTACAAVTITILWATARKRAEPRPPLLTQARATQVAMLVEALVVGYSLARKATRSR